MLSVNHYTLLNTAAHSFLYQWGWATMMLRVCASGHHPRRALLFADPLWVFKGWDCSCDTDNRFVQ